MFKEDKSMAPWIMQLDDDTRRNLIVALVVIATVFAVWFFSNEQRAKKVKEGAALTIKLLGCLLIFPLYFVLLVVGVKVMWDVYSSYFTTDFTDGYQKVVAGSLVLLVAMKLLDLYQRSDLYQKSKKQDISLLAVRKTPQTSDVQS
jgi:hypothetical protein